jgi:hypothetical protein
MFSGSPMFNVLGVNMETLYMPTGIVKSIDCALHGLRFPE